MIARLQKLTTLALVAIAMGWAAVVGTAGHPWWAVGGAGFILFGYASFLAFEFATLWFVHGTDAAPRANVAQLVRAWLGEVASAPKVFCWRQPFRSRVIPDHLPTEPTAGRRGVVLVPGFLCNRGFWNPWMTGLRARGVPFVAVDLEPVFGSIDDYLASLEVAVQRVEAATGMAPVLVGHSMGGLVLRAWLNTQLTDTRVHRLITIGTPHHGTWLAQFGHTRNGKQMRIGSPWLTDLVSRETSKPWHARFTCFYSHCDNIVFPPSTATLPGADNLHLTATAHVHMAFHPQVFDEVLRRLDSTT